MPGVLEVEALGWILCLRSWTVFYSGYGPKDLTIIRENNVEAWRRSGFISYIVLFFHPNRIGTLDNCKEGFQPAVSYRFLNYVLNSLLRHGFIGSGIMVPCSDHGAWIVNTIFNSI